MAEFATGATFADHVIRGVAGRGGMGVVYRALHVPLKREVGLKVIAPEASADDAFRTRFRHEFEAAAAIQHPNVIPIYHAGEEDGLLYVTMRFVEGIDLARLVAVETRLEPVRAARLIAQVAAGLDAAHRTGVVHRDVKPANVLLEGEAEAEHAVLTDFGLTKFMNSDTKVTQTGILVGTFDYTAPEQLDETGVDARTDVYALGCVLFQALTGRVPYPRASLPAKLLAHFEATPPSVTALVPEAPVGLDAVIAQALAKQAGDRFQSAGDLARAALAAVDRPALARGVSQLVAGETTPGWQWVKDSAPPAEGIPLQAALTGEIASGPFVGREAVLARLRERYTLAQSGERQIVLLSGEPGIGKSRLAIELAREAHAGGATVLFGRSDAESLVPYQPFVAAVQHYMAHRETVALPGDLELSELARLVPALRRHLPTLHDPIAEDPETRRYRLFEAVTRVLAYVASESPTVLILDDLQWADTSTALLLGHLLRDVEAGRLLVLGTFREGGGSRCEEIPALLTQLHRDPGFERIAVTGLDEAEIEALVASHDERGVKASFVRRLQEGTEGNPFFIKATLRSLAEVDGDELERALDRIAVPEDVKELIDARLARLGETAKQVLTVASVVGREFRLEVLEALIDEPVESIIAALEEAGAAGLVGEVEDDADRFLFPQALVREALYERQSASRRVRLHHRIADALEHTRPAATPAELAYHFLESRHLDREGKAIDYAVQVAEQATGSLAYAEAAAHYRRALGALDALGDPDPLRRSELLLALGGAESRHGEPVAAETFARAAELARDAGLPEQLARAALGRSPRWTQGGAIDREGIALLESALAALGEQQSPLVVMAQARLAILLHFAGEAERVDELSLRALELARELDDPGALVAALQSRHAALFHIEHLDERLGLSQELLALAQRIGERELQATAHHWRGYDLLEAADVDAAREEARAIARLADELRQPAYWFLAARWDLMWALLADRLDEVEPLIGRVHALGTRARLPEADVEAMAQQLAVAYRQRATGAFAPILEASIEQNPHLEVNRPALALAQLHAGKREAAVAEFERLARDDFATFPRDILWFSGVCVLADVCALIGDARRAQVLYRLLLPYRHRYVLVGMATCFGSAERFLGLLATTASEWDTAAEHFEAALASNTGAGVVSGVRMVRDDYAAMQLARAEPPAPQ